MPNSKTLLKFVFVLGICAVLFAILMLFIQAAIVRRYTEEPESEWPLLQEENLFTEGDYQEEINNEILVHDIESRIPSLPIFYWRKHRNTTQKKSPTCAKYPSIFDLEFNNHYWQTLRTSDGTFQLFGAYYDIRKYSALGPTIRILGMIDRIEPKVKTYCQFWFDNKKESIIVETFEYKFIWNENWGNYKQGIYQPYLIACQIPKAFHGTAPATVSLVEKECDTATNNLRVIYNPPPDEQKKGFAVCVKGLDFLYDDLSVRLIEWIEMIKILGADKIFFYELQSHRNVSKVLKHYEREGLVEVTPLTLAGGQPNIPGFQHLYLAKHIIHKRVNEIIPYNDCLYKNMYMYDFIALLDIDEVILPMNDMTWPELMQRVLRKSRLFKNGGGFDSYNVRNVYFLNENHTLYEDIPQFMLMLQHVNRAQNHTKAGDNIKCFHNPELVLSLHNHFPLLCLRGPCESYPIDTVDAQMQHYCALKKNCEKFRENSVKDMTVWKYKEELVQRSLRTLDRLGFYP